MCVCVCKVCEYKRMYVHVSRICMHVCPCVCVKECARVYNFFLVFQVQFHGFPGTMGSEFIHYLASDRFTSPPGCVCVRVCLCVCVLCVCVCVLPKILSLSLSLSLTHTHTHTTHTHTDHADQFSERLMLLPHTYLTNDHRQSRREVPTLSFPIPYSFPPGWLFPSVSISLSLSLSVSVVCQRAVETLRGIAVEQ
jgi:hypothetical protein